MGGGAPLPAGPRAFLERVLRRPLGAVRLHTGPEAAAVTGEIGAAAATLGRHIMVGPAHASFASPRGLALLAHEAVHALQAGPSGESTATAREEEGQALEAEETVRRALSPGLPRVAGWPVPGILPTLPLVLRRPGAPTSAPGRAAEAGPPASMAGGFGPVPRPVRAVPAAGPLRRAVSVEGMETSTAAAQAETPGPAGGQQPGAQGQAPDVEALAEEIYRRLRYRLNLEREWRGFS